MPTLEKTQVRISASKRDDAIATARVPRHIKAQGDAVLRSLGSSPTELVNSAYRYVIAEHRLPTVRSEAEGTFEIALTPEQRQALRARRERTTCRVPAEYWGGRSDEDILASELGRAYEALA